MIKKIIKFIIKKSIILVFFSVVWRKFNFKKNKFGLNFIGFYNFQIGLGEAMRGLCASTENTDIPFLIRKFEPNIRSKKIKSHLSAYEEEFCRYQVNCICMNPDVMYGLPYWFKREEWANRYNVGCWFWELPNFPDRWRYAKKIVDEVWVSTEYLRDIMKKSGIPVYKIPFVVDLQDFSSESLRDKMGVSENDFLFVFNFDYNSSVYRKNPQAIIKAFLAAFSSASNVKLIIKTSNAQNNLQQMDELLQIFDGDERISLVDANLPREEINSLLNGCDCYVSLHRAEGLGLGMAEAMYLGKPVIATAFSGNMDFMNDDNSILIPCELVPVEAGQYPDHQGQVWAEPDFDAAVRAMIRVYSDGEYRRRLGQNAARYMREHHSIEVASQAIKNRMYALNRELNSHAATH